MITIALPKGRLGDKTYALLSQAGYGIPAMENVGRKLVIEDEEKGIRYLLVKPADVAVYVEKGAADLGVVGKDILEEEGADVFEVLDLGYGHCHMAVAAKEGYKEDPSRRPEAEIDYIHGEASLRALAARPGAVGFLLPEIDKNSFFSDVKKLGVLPRKTFSMGEADEKRFYMEAREIE